MFPEIGSIDNYMALPPGKRALYNQYALLKYEQAARNPGCPFLKKR